MPSFYDEYPRLGPTALRPILPCYWAAFAELEEWVEKSDAPPQSTFVAKPDQGGVVNRCSLGKEATYVAR